MLVIRRGGEGGGGGGGRGEGPGSLYARVSVKGEGRLREDKGEESNPLAS